MNKKEKITADLAHQTTPIKADELTKATMDLAPTDSKSENNAAPKKVSKKTKTEKVEKNTSKKVTATPKETKNTKKTTPSTPKVEKMEPIEQVYFQYAGNELSSQAISEQVKQSWIASGNNLSDIQTLNLYIKPEDNATYYVINNTEYGKIDL